MEDPKQLTVNVGDMARFTCVGIYPQVRYDVCITSLYKPADMRCDAAAHEMPDSYIHHTTLSAITMVA